LFSAISPPDTAPPHELDPEYVPVIEASDAEPVPEAVAEQEV
jgi:hypothetical protein